MKHTIQFTYVHQSMRRAKMESILKEAGIPIRQAEYTGMMQRFEITLPADDSRIPTLDDAVLRVFPDVKRFTSHELTYDRYDIEQAVLCIFGVGYPHIGKPVFHFGTKYDIAERCKACGSLGYRVGPLRHPFAKIRSRRRFECFPDGETIVRKDVAEALAKLTGSWDDLVQAIDSDTGKPVSWWQILPRFTMPPMDWDASDLDVSRVCSVCKRACFTENPGAGWERPIAPPTYRIARDKIACLPDFAQSWEIFGPDPRDWGESRILYISRRVALYLLDMKIEAVGLTPVRFI